MSTASKKRRKVREWMAVEKARREDALSRAQADADRRVKDERTRWTKMLAPKEEVCHPLGRPEQTEYHVMPLQGGYPSFREFNPRDLRYYDSRLKTYRFRVKQYAQVMPCGLRVVWYGLEHVG